MSLSLRGKRWVWPAVDPDQAAFLAGELDLEPSLARLLINRGISGPGAAGVFLNPASGRLHSPWLMLDMDKAVGRLLSSLEKNEKVIVHGDYDADGITATVILTETLHRLGADVEFYLPSRFGHGYGLHRAAVDEIAARGASLLVTVDCGTNAVDETAYAQKRGLDVIVTDHHLLLSALPPASAVVNPRRENCPYPFKELSGAGIAFKLACALLEKINLPLPGDLLDLAALGTAADVVPLLDENRIIVSLGLEVLRQSKRPGFQALIEAAGLEGGGLSSRSLAFVLAPAINAAGRMGEALPAAKLLLSKNPGEAALLAGHLLDLNRLRRSTEQAILQEAEQAVFDLPAGEADSIITLAGETWHHGVIGIVASRLVDRFHRPFCLVAVDGEAGRGSARSIPGFDITSALAACSETLERFGGHKQAAGFSIRPDRVSHLRHLLQDYARRHLDKDILVPRLHLDAELGAEEINLDLAASLERLEPFGTKNPAPLFGSRGWTLRSWRLVGSDRSHLKLNLEKNGQVLETIFFSGAHHEPFLERGRSADLAFKLRRSYFRKQETLEIEVGDLYFTGLYSSARLNLVDRRESVDRFDRARAIITRSEGRAAVYTATRARADSLLKGLALNRDPLVLTGGAGNGDVEMPANRGPVILFDLPFHENFLAGVQKNGQAKNTLTFYLLYGRKDLELNRRLLELSLPTKNHLAAVAAALEKGPGPIGEVSLPQVVEKALNFKPGPGFLKRVESIFLETGLFKDGRPFNLSKQAGDDLLHSLQSSSTFTRTRELYGHCESFQQLFLEASPEEIAVHLENLEPW